VLGRKLVSADRRDELRGRNNVRSFARSPAQSGGRGSAITLAATPTAPDAGTGTVRVRVAHAGFIVGGGAGRGVLWYRGRAYPFTVGGLGVGQFGAAAADLVGRAYYLRGPWDLAGTYTSVGAGVALVGGARVTRLQNANGVVLQLGGRAGRPGTVGEPERR
jgi:hypothetical protein